MEAPSKPVIIIEITVMPSMAPNELLTAIPMGVVTECGISERSSISFK